MTTRKTTAFKIFLVRLGFLGKRKNFRDIYKFYILEKQSSFKFEKSWKKFGDFWLINEKIRGVTIQALDHLSIYSNY
jgi:hypothetical protein